MSDLRRLKMVVAVTMMVFLTSLLGLNILHRFIHNHEVIGASHSVSGISGSDEQIVKIWAESNGLLLGGHSFGEDRDRG